MSRNTHEPIPAVVYFEEPSDQSDKVTLTLTKEQVSILFDVMNNEWATSKRVLAQGSKSGNFERWMAKREEQDKLLVWALKDALDQ